jgi:membrane-bound serine protease (ClpP class)
VINPCRADTVPGVFFAAAPSSRGNLGSLRQAIRLVFALLLLLAGAATSVCAQEPAGPTATAAGPSGWGQVAGWVVSPWATIVLLALGCLLLFIDLLTLHTWGLAGTLGVVAIALVFAAHLTVGGGGWIGIVLALAGVALLLLETHVFPGHGIAGVAGLVVLFAGMFYALGGSQNAVFALSVSTLLTIAAIIGFFAYLPRSAVWQHLLSQQMQQRASLGYVTSENMTHFLGHTGRATTVLRPSGMAEIDGYRLHVVTEGEFLNPGTPLIVTRVEGSRIVVDDIALTAAGPSEESLPAGEQTRAA